MSELELERDLRPDWVQTYTGQVFILGDPVPWEVSIVDIAHSLSMQCRYNGHCRAFYSVAQHSVIVSEVLEEWGESREEQMRGLLHDAAEAYIGDMVAPLKREMGEFRVAEDRIEKVIAEYFGLGELMTERVRRADLVVLATERRDLMGPCRRSWNLEASPRSLPILPLSPAEAIGLFSRRFVDLQAGRGGHG